MSFDPIGKIVGHTYDGQGAKVLYSKKSGANPSQAEQLGEEFISFLKNDKDQYANNGDDLLSKDEATNGFKAFLKAKYNAADDCIAQFLPDFETSWNESFAAWQGADSATVKNIVNGEVKFSSLVVPYGCTGAASPEYVQFPSYQFFADDDADDSKDGVFQKIVNLSQTKNSLCEVTQPTPPAPPPVPAPPVIPTPPAKITTLTLAGLNGKLDAATGMFTVGSADTYDKIATAVLKDSEAKKIIDARLRQYLDDHIGITKVPSLQEFTEQLIKEQAVKEGAGNQKWPVIGKSFNLYEALNPPVSSVPAVPTITEPTVVEGGGETVVTTTTTTTTAGGSGLFGRLGSLGSKWLLVLGAVGLGFLIENRRASA